MALGTHGSRCCSWGTCRLESHPIDGATRSGFDSLRGPPQTICANASIDRPSAHWGPNDTIVFTFGINVGGNLMRVSANGDTPEQLTKAGSESRRAVSCRGTGRRRSCRTARTSSTPPPRRTVCVRRSFPLLPGESKVLAELGEAAGARYLSTGHLVYGQSGSLMAVSFDASEGKTRGAPQPIGEGVHTKPAGATLFRGLRQRLVGLRSRRQTACLRYRFWRRPEHLHLRYRAWHAHPIHF